MLAPNPNRGGDVDRVVVVGRSADQNSVIVLNIDALSKNPNLLRFPSSRHISVSKFWNAVIVLVLVGFVALSFFWHWWAFIAGFIVSLGIHHATRHSVPGFDLESLAENPENFAYYASQGLVWEASPQSVVPEVRVLSPA